MFNRDIEVNFNLNGMGVAWFQQHSPKAIAHQKTSSHNPPEVVAANSSTDVGGVECKLPIPGSLSDPSIGDSVNRIHRPPHATIYSEYVTNNAGNQSNLNFPQSQDVRRTPSRRHQPRRMGQMQQKNSSKNK